MTVIVLAVGLFIWGMLRVPAIEKDAEATLKPYKDPDQEQRTPE